ncbi:hypothetical protein [Labrenzia sp. PHM005]|uniref:hypothetical protein n=1 Tax=Labrenzia sp. PHM005 TaxID=2590016 RepID=UPI00113FE35A|nr:hypothetical protein [Labrenzia sp. PHM005]QDG78533.1 hypothetical protein FJ695_23215 [Labrenzia sp. PHM005]
MKQRKNISACSGLKAHFHAGIEFGSTQGILGCLPECKWQMVDLQFYLTPQAVTPRTGNL